MQSLAVGICGAREPAFVKRFQVIWMLLAFGPDCGY